MAYHSTQAMDPDSHFTLRREASSRGFTLVELVVTMAIAAVLATLAAPAIQGILAKHRMAGIGSQFTGHILRTRNEAVSRNTCAVMCLSKTTETAITTDASGNVTAGPRCANSDTDWQQGWIAFLKEDCVSGSVTVANSRPVRPEDYIVIRSSIGTSYNLQAQGSSPPNRFHFDANGRPSLNGAAEFDLQYESPNSEFTQNYGFNICVDSVGRSRTISWSASCT